MFLLAALVLRTHGHQIHNKCLFIKNNNHVYQLISCFITQSQKMSPELTPESEAVIEPADITDPLSIS